MIRADGDLIVDNRCCKLTKFAELMSFTNPCEIAVSRVNNGSRCTVSPPPAERDFFCEY